MSVSECLRERVCVCGGGACVGKRREGMCVYVNGCISV